MNLQASEDAPMTESPLLRRSRVIALAVALTLGTATSAHAAGVAPAKATPAQRDQAQTHFLKGRDLAVATEELSGIAFLEKNRSISVRLGASVAMAICRTAGSVDEQFRDV